MSDWEAPHTADLVTSRSSVFTDSSEFNQGSGDDRRRPVRGASCFGVVHGHPLTSIYKGL